MDVLELAQRLIAIPSVSPMRPAAPDDPPCERAMTEFLLDWFAQRGIAAEAVEATFGRASVVATLPGKPGRGTLILDAHQDTVPPAAESDRPFEGRIVDGRLCGRGACDVKGPMAAMLVAFERLSALSPSERPPIAFVATCDEEFGQAGAIDVVRRWKRGEFAACVPERVDGVVVAEPTGLQPVVAHNGVLRWTITTHGRAAHSSRPELGVSAIERMGLVIAAWSGLAERLRTSGLDHPRCGRPRTSIGRIVGGTAVNIVPDRCEIEIDRRLVPGETFESVRGETAALLASIPEARATSGEAWTESLPLVDDRNGSLAAALACQVERLGRSSVPIGVPFGTHAPRYAELGGPVVVFGPGSIDQAHTIDEWIAIDELEAAVDVVERWALEFLPDHDAGQ
ncbi:MAG TPA: acetylornithine deacetylase [Planctomycetaceae bacterium]|nr:acetylornithine deacetylase [Planctomycetaceae bacterium]HRF02040.1 M20 family metallopeptidase [Pirellulaceae bacterium]